MMNRWIDAEIRQCVDELTLIRSSMDNAKVSDNVRERVCDYVVSKLKDIQAVCVTVGDSVGVSHIRNVKLYFTEKSRRDVLGPFQASGKILNATNFQKIKTLIDDVLDELANTRRYGWSSDTDNINNLRLYFIACRIH